MTTPSRPHSSRTDALGYWLSRRSVAVAAVTLAAGAVATVAALMVLTGPSASLLGAAIVLGLTGTVSALGFLGYAHGFAHTPDAESTEPRTRQRARGGQRSTAATTVPGGMERMTNELGTPPLGHGAQGDHVHPAAPPTLPTAAGRRHRQLHPIRLVSPDGGHGSPAKLTSTAHSGPASACSPRAGGGGNPNGPGNHPRGIG